MSLAGIDYSTGRPHPLAIKAAGKHFVVRYVSPLHADGSASGKDITKAEYDALRAAGVEVDIVFESYSGRAKEGHAAGVADAKTFLVRIQQIGIQQFGAHRPGFFAVDFDAQGSALTASVDYIRGVASVLGFTRTGVYGGFHVVKACLDARVCAWAWQTLAWSYGQWDPRAHLRQTGSTVVDRCVVDTNVALVADYGQWPAPVAPAVKPVPAPVPAPVITAPLPPAPKYPGKPLGWPSSKTTYNGPALVAVQHALNQAGIPTPVTGKYDAATNKSLRIYQRGHKWAWLRDLVGLGAAGKHLFASLISYYVKIGK